MYLEMLQQRYGAGLEKSSAALVGTAMRHLGRGMANPKLHKWIKTGLRGSGISALEKGYGLLSGSTSKLGRTTGSVLRDLGYKLINPNLHRRITTGLQNSGRAARRMGNELTYNPVSQRGFKGGVATGLGTGIAGYGMYRTLNGSTPDTADAQPNNPKTYIPDINTTPEDQL